MLEIIKLSKSYGKVTALKELSLNVKAGEIHGIIGPDGSGKTTALRITAGLLKADKGSVLVNGFNPAVDYKAIKQFLGYMPQRFSLYQDLTIGENLAFFASLFNLNSTEKRRKTKQLLAFSRLAPFIDRPSGKLSGGMKQKLALMCTLLHNPKLLILDEPTNGVDPVSREEFWLLLKKLADEGMSILVTTPYMDETEKCNSISLLYNGELLANGNYDEICANSKSHFWQMNGRDAFQCYKQIADSTFQGVGVYRFGQNFHLYSQDIRAIDIVKHSFVGHEIEIVKIAPNIEDVFIELIKNIGQVVQ